MQYYYCQRYCTIQKMSTSLLLVQVHLLSLPISIAQENYILTKKLSFQIADYVYEANYYFFFQISGAKISSNGQ